MQPGIPGEPGPNLVIIINITQIGFKSEIGPCSRKTFTLIIYIFLNICTNSIYVWRYYLVELVTKHKCQAPKSDFLIYIFFLIWGKFIFALLKIRKKYPDNVFFQDCRFKISLRKWGLALCGGRPFSTVSNNPRFSFLNSLV